MQSQSTKVDDLYVEAQGSDLNSFEVSALPGTDRGVHWHMRTYVYRHILLCWDTRSPDSPQIQTSHGPFRYATSPIVYNPIRRRGLKDNTGETKQEINCVFNFSNGQDPDDLDGGFRLSNMFVRTVTFKSSYWFKHL